MGVVARPKPGLDIGERGREAGQVRLLRQIAEVAPGWTKRLPRSGSVRPAAIFSSVDLPDPLRPTRQVRSPGPMASSASIRSGVPPKVRAMFRR